MKLKQKLLVIIIAATTTTSVTAASINSFTDTDVASLFEQNVQPLQLAVLSAQEMKGTEGAWWPYVAAGAAGSFASGINYYHGNRNRTWGGWGTAVGTGVVGGAITASRWWSSAFWGTGTALAGSWAAPRVSKLEPKVIKPAPRPTYHRNRVMPYYCDRWSC